MNLKEAFRFQNKLETLMHEAQDILRRDSNLVRVQTTLLRNKVIEDAEDKVIQDPQESEFADKITDIARFLMHLLAEREKLSKAIHDAKGTLSIDMDSEMSLNNKRQELARVFRHMCDLRGSDTTLSSGGIGYRFNQEGNQISYRCDLRRVTTINFDRKVPRNFVAELDKKSDAVSAELDRCMVNSTVRYQEPFNVNDSFAEVFSTFADSDGAA